MLEEGRLADEALEANDELMEENEAENQEGSGLMEESSARDVPIVSAPPNQSATVTSQAVQAVPSKPADRRGPHNRHEAKAQRQKVPLSS